MYQKRRAIEHVLVLCFDLLAMILAFLLAVFFRYGTWNWVEAEGNQSQQITLMVILYVALNVVTNYYSSFFKRRFSQELWAVIKEEIVFYTVLLVVYFLIHETGSLSRLMTFYLVLFQTLFTILFRSLLKQYMLKSYTKGRFVKRMILISTRQEAGIVVRRLQRSPDWNSVLMGVILVDDEPADRLAASPEAGLDSSLKSVAGPDPKAGLKSESGTDPESGSEANVNPDEAQGFVSGIEGVPVVAGREELLDYIIHHRVDEVFFSYEGMEKDPQSRKWIQEVQMTGILVDVNIEVFNLVDNGTKTLNRVGDYAVVSFARNVISTRGMIAKRLMDIIGGLIGMAAFGLSAIVLVPAIRLDSPGPAIFSQIRVGKNGRKFRLYKYRSMRVDAEQLKDDLICQNEMSGPMFKVEDDPRITRIGKWLRRTSLDEFPQFWNVLKGDMSLVGTRPPTVDEFEQYTAMHKARLSMTPGLTGIWQTSGRSDIKDFDDIRRMDMEYIDNWSLGRDFRILLKTIPVVFGAKGAK